MGYARTKKKLVPRVRYTTSLPISLELIGTQNLYELSTVNISRGGVFIEYDEAYLPFHENSLLEVQIHLDSGEDAPRVNFVGKFVHHRIGEGFGIKISQMEDADRNLWDDFLIEMDRDHGEG